MGRRHLKPEQIIYMLREAEIKLAGGKTTGEVCRELGISEQSYDRWRKEYGGMQVSQPKKLKDLERENTRLKRPAVIERILDHLRHTVEPVDPAHPSRAPPKGDRLV